MKQSVYSEEFKIEAVNMCLLPGANKNAISRNLGVNPNTLHSWIKKHHKKQMGTSMSDGLVSDNDYIKLEKKYKKLALEHEILKKAVGILTKELP